MFNIYTYIIPLFFIICIYEISIYPKNDVIICLRGSYRSDLTPYYHHESHQTKVLRHTWIIRRAPHTAPRNKVYLDIWRKSSQINGRKCFKWYLRMHQASTWCPTTHRTPHTAHRTPYPSNTTPSQAPHTNTRAPHIRAPTHTHTHTYTHPYTHTHTQTYIYTPTSTLYIASH